MTDFCWLDLKTRDVAGTAAFFSAALGWRFEVDEQDFRRATKIHVGDRRLGGVSDLANPVYPPGIPAHIAFYLRVDDVDRRTEIAVEHGAQLVAGPFDAGDQGRLSTLLDPAGAAVSFWEPRGFAGWTEPPGRLVLTCADPITARGFYERALGAAPPSAVFVQSDADPPGWELALPVDDLTAVAEHGSWSADGSALRLHSPEGVGFLLTSARNVLP
ncbi:VOC family protein [Amycolatopsis magusensis]|uniref:VOC family protein n=1 Tax=Amycolatopsis magusensis TaxID=882444 RepID=UPI003C2D19B4